LALTAFFGYLLRPGADIHWDVLDVQPYGQGAGMDSGIRFKKIWQDEHALELEITTNSGDFLFCIQVYVGHEELSELVRGLARFKVDIQSGACVISFGQFTPEYASGAYRAELSFLKEGRGYLYISVDAQSAWTNLVTKQVASRAETHLKSEPVLLDAFVEDLRKLSEGSAEEAFLQVI
jgi:hypothetical protein